MWGKRKIWKRKNELREAAREEKSWEVPLQQKSEEELNRNQSSERVNESKRVDEEFVKVDLRKYASTYAENFLVLLED